MSGMNGKYYYCIMYSFFPGEGVENVLDDILDGNPGDDDLNTEVHVDDNPAVTTTSKF